MKEPPIEERHLDGITYGQFKRFLEAETMLRSLGITMDYSKISPHIPSADSVIPISKSFMFVYLDKQEERAKYGIQRERASRMIERLEKHHDLCSLKKSKDRETCVDCVDSLMDIFQDAGERLSHRKRSTDAEKTRIEAKLTRKISRIARKRERIGRDYEDIALYFGPSGGAFAITYALTGDAVLAGGVAAAAETPVLIGGRNWTESREDRLDRREDDAYGAHDRALRGLYAEQAFDFARIYLQTVVPSARKVCIKYPEGVNYAPKFDENLQNFYVQIEDQLEAEKKAAISG